jgi:hypothetical protein
MLTACGLALLTGCGGAGSGFGADPASEVPTAVVLDAGVGGQVQAFEVDPGGTAPLEVTAVGYKGGQLFNNIIPDEMFVWAARFVNPATDPPSIATYTVGAAPNGFKTCPAVPKTTPFVPILQQFGGGTPSAYPGYTLLPTAQSAATVFLGAVPGIAAPYCLLIQATSVNGSVIGAHTVIVSHSP